MVQNRLERVRARMAHYNMSHLLVSSPDAIFYLTGVEIHPGERLLCLSISQTECTLVVSALYPLSSFEFPVIYFKDTENVIEALSQTIHEDQVIGVDKFWASHFLLKLMAKRPNSQYVVGSPAVDDVRLCKDEIEIEHMRRASLINDQVMREVIHYIETEGASGELTELMVQKKVIEINASLDVHEMSFTPTVCFGKNGAEPHHDVDDTLLEPNSAVVIDIGGRVDGYCSDMTRSFFFGTPSEKYKEVYQLVLEANKKAIAAVKPGVKLSDIDQIARAVIEEGGYGQFFTHRTGHGIGINVHEFPDVSGTSDSVCEPGMIFSIEPGIYLLGEFGVRIEDLVCVTENGCEVLNHVNKELL